MEPSSSATSFSTCCPTASMASAATVSSPTAGAPRTSRERGDCSTCRRHGASPAMLAAATASRRLSGEGTRARQADGARSASDGGARPLHTGRRQIAPPGQRALHRDHCSRVLAHRSLTPQTLPCHRAACPQATARGAQIPIALTRGTAEAFLPAVSSPEASRMPAARASGTVPAAAGVREPLT